MLKIAGILLLLGGCTAAGMAKCSEMEKRVKQLWELEKILGILEGEIGYAKGTLSECFRHVAAQSSPVFAGFFGKMAEEMEGLMGRSLAEVFAHHIEGELRESALRKEEKEQLRILGSQLGRMDVGSQMDALSFCKKRIIEYGEAAREEYKQKAKVYRCVGVTGGLFLTIILI